MSKIFAISFNYSSHQLIFMPLFDGNRYKCINCGREQDLGMFNRNFERPIKCKKCKGWICVVCHRSDEHGKMEECPVCGGELYYPLFDL